MLYKKILLQNLSQYTDMGSVVLEDYGRRPTTIGGNTSKFVNIRTVRLKQKVQTRIRLLPIGAVCSGPHCLPSASYASITALYYHMVQISG